MLVVIGFGALSACGANLQSVYEGDVRFERCMALDHDGVAARSVRLRCWREWLEQATYAQTRDRISHAERRASELAKD
jgi:hypothetical protein